MNKGVLLILLSGFLFGSAGILAKHLIVTYGLSPITISALRLCIAAGVIVCAYFATRKEKKRLGKKHLFLFLLGGLTAAGYQLVFFFAVQRVYVSIATLLALCTNPLFVALLSAVLFKERIPLLTIGSLGASIVGTVLIIGVQGGDAAASSPLGYVLAICAGCVFAVYTLNNKRLIADYPPLLVSAMNFSIGSVFVLPFAALPAGLPIRGWLMIAALGVLFTGLGYICFSIGLTKATATQASIGSLFEPFTSTVLSVLLLREAYTPAQVAGGVLLVLSLLSLLFRDSLLRLFGRRNAGIVPKKADTSMVDSL